ncbi:hypothetical protein L5515_006238 [Caenorhabditis briggsae]|uniref:Uncharacterized protein n=1 Tax=Caenorhabditis briggsae TaxID=6238 RepID=A0AAE9F1I1_CAEBR|nr:hypothetical protein L5515_006238 [Caenorhabditis briggsae]
MSCSLCDVFVPVGIFNYRYAFTIFVTDGFFETPSKFGRYLLSFRCSYITGTYAILHSHFVSRYMILVWYLIFLLHFLE